MEDGKNQEGFSLHDLQSVIPNIVKEEKIQSSMDSEKLPPLDEVERILDYEFKDKSLLDMAFTHESYRDKFSGSYERLEFYGDSVLNLLITRDHYFSYPNLQSGELTKLRSANVNTEKLARVAVKHNLHKYLRHEKSLLHGKVEEFMEALEEYPSNMSGLIEAPKVLADIVESIIGAVFLDTNSSLDDTWKVWKKLMDPIITPETLQAHPMTGLCEFCQRHGLKAEFVDLWNEKGTFDVFADDEFVASGIYKAKKSIALYRAANEAYYQLVRNLNEAMDNVKLG